MAAHLGSTTYSAVTWTAGDVITEAKLDAMVANDQAYDSHAAQGLLLNNDKALAGKDSGGTAKDIVRINTSDEVVFGYRNGGWTEYDGTFTYASWDSTVATGTITVASGAANFFAVGMRIRISQSTGGVKYGIITVVADTLLTVYFGTDYTLNNEAISSPHFSCVKAPKGFPISPAKWTVSASDSSNRNQTPPFAAWENTSAVSIVIPIGVWEVYHECTMDCQDTTSENINFKMTLSTANNSQSDAEFTDSYFFAGATGTVRAVLTGKKSKILTLAAKTTYYQNFLGDAGDDFIKTRGDLSPSLVKAVCAYL